jgi:hypothetical protein
LAVPASAREIADKETEATPWEKGVVGEAKRASTHARTGEERSFKSRREPKERVEVASTNSKG